MQLTREAPTAQDEAIRAGITRPIKVTDLELLGPIEGLSHLDGYESAKLLVRLGGTPLGWTTVPVVNGHCDAHTLVSAARRDLLEPLVRELVYRRVGEPLTDSALDIRELLAFEPQRVSRARPEISVVVCTRDRPEELDLCLAAIARLAMPAAEVLVVDNAPSSDATERLVRERHPTVRYVREPRPGLDWARNRAIAEARSEIIAFTDDDVIVDAAWTGALADVFAEAPHVHAVTGLVVPFELETAAQQDFENYGGFGRGFSRAWNLAGSHHGAGRFGTGANMAFRRKLFDRIGTFDPMLDVGTASDGGGDLDMYFRILQEGYVLVYEPRAIVRHRHRPESERLRKQMRDWGKGLFVYMRRATDRYPGERRRFRQLKRWWVWRYIVRRYLLSFVRTTPFRRDLIVQEVRGALRSRRAYRDARRGAERIARESGEVAELPRAAPGGERPAGAQGAELVAVRTVELAGPLRLIGDIDGARAVQLYLMREGRPVGTFEVATGGQPLSVPQQRDVLADFFTPPLLKHRRPEIGEQIERWFERTGARGPRVAATRERPRNEMISIVVATFDRPDDLRACLRSLVAQASARPREDHRRGQPSIVGAHQAGGGRIPLRASDP